MSFEAPFQYNGNGDVRFPGNANNHGDIMPNWMQFNQQGDLKIPGVANSHGDLMPEWVATNGKGDLVPSYYDERAIYNFVKYDAYNPNNSWGLSPTTSSKMNNAFRFLGEDSNGRSIIPSLHPGLIPILKFVNVNHWKIDTMFVVTSEINEAYKLLNETYTNLTQKPKPMNILLNCEVQLLPNESVLDYLKRLRSDVYTDYSDYQKQLYTSNTVNLFKSPEYLSAAVNYFEVLENLGPEKLLAIELLNTELHLEKYNVLKVAESIDPSRLWYFKIEDDPKSPDESTLVYFKRQYDRFIDTREFDKERLAHNRYNLGKHFKYLEALIIHWQKREILQQKYGLAPE